MLVAGPILGHLLTPLPMVLSAIAKHGPLASTAINMGAAGLAATWRPIPRGLAVLGIFGVTYGALTLALRHPDALRSWQSLTGSRAS